jgi:hypothetical protein
VIDARTIAGQVRAFGYHVEAGEQSETLVANQVHDVALAFGANELECQQAPQGLLGGDHLGAGEVGLAQHVGQPDVPQERYEEEEAAEAGAEGAGFQVQGPHVGSGLSSRPERRGTLVIEAARQPGEAFLAQQDSEGINTDGVSGLGQFALDVVDREVPFAQGHDEFAYPITGRSVTWPMLDRLKEAELLVGVLAELVAEDTKRAGRVAEAARDLLGRAAFEEVGAEGLVLSVQGVFGGEEEVGDRR